MHNFANMLCYKSASRIGQIGGSANALPCRFNTINYILSTAYTAILIGDNVKRNFLKSYSIGKLGRYKTSNINVFQKSNRYHRFRSFRSILQYRVLASAQYRRLETTSNLIRSKTTRPISIRTTTEMWLYFAENRIGY